MRPGGWLLATAPRRAAGEAGVGCLALSLAVATLVAGASPLLSRPLLDLSALYLGLLGGLAGALRLRAGRALGSEVGPAALIVVAVAAAVALGQLVGAAWLAVRPGPGELSSRDLVALPLVGGALAAVNAAFGCGVARGAVAIWRRWERRRRSRLLWALTHAQLLAALAVAVGVAVVLTASDLGAGPRLASSGVEARLADAGPSVRLLALLLFRLLPAAGGLLVLSAAVALALLPLAALVSYRVLRRATRRLEQLASAAAQLRAGDLSARVAVGGEDEIASLQVDFNRMAADLERTLGDLQAERDRVAGLLEARRQLVASVSHELRTPVATVRGHLEAARRRGAAAPSDLATMASEVARLERLIEDLFTLARAEVGRLDLRPGPTDAGALVRRLVEAVAPLAWTQRRVEVLADVPPSLPPAYADPQRLEQIVSNLLGNAVRHTPPGGLVAASVAPEGDALRVEVRDTGEGIAPEELPRVFERFYRGRGGDGAGAAGLGLALVKELAEAMGGTVEAASTPGEGSRLTVRLPRAGAPPRPLAADGR
jgi:signal transduction histidine kinase